MPPSIFPALAKAACELPHRKFHIDWQFARPTGPARTSKSKFLDRYGKGSGATSVKSLRFPFASAPRAVKEFCDYEEIPPSHRQFRVYKKRSGFCLRLDAPQLFSTSELGN